VNSTISSWHKRRGRTNKEWKWNAEMKRLNVGKNVGLYFERSLDRTAITAVVLTPVVGSLVFAVIWLSIFIRKGKDNQLVVSTAFTVASYLVTAGMFSFILRVRVRNLKHLLQALWSLHWWRTLMGKMANDGEGVWLMEIVRLSKALHQARVFQQTMAIRRTSKMVSYLPKAVHMDPIMLVHIGIPRYRTKSEPGRILAFV